MRGLGGRPDVPYERMSGFAQPRNILLGGSCLAISIESFMSRSTIVPARSTGSMVPSILTGPGTSDSIAWASLAQPLQTFLLHNLSFKQLTSLRSVCRATKELVNHEPANFSMPVAQKVLAPGMRVDTASSQQLLTLFRKQRSPSVQAGRDPDLSASVQVFAQPTSALVACSAVGLHINCPISKLA